MDEGRGENKYTTNQSFYRRRRLNCRRWARGRVFIRRFYTLFLIELNICTGFFCNFSTGSSPNELVAQTKPVGFPNKRAATLRLLDGAGVSDRTNSSTGRFSSPNNCSCFLIPSSSHLHRRYPFIKNLEMEDSFKERDVKSPNLFERATEEIEAAMHKEKRHHKETHGMSDDIDESTPIDKVKGPNVFHRAKEEFEALVDSFNPKKDREHEDDDKKQEGCLGSLARGLEKFCLPSTGKRN
ncbi:hypothetical protein HPP92_007486 [Vanilla planifolia]|uniref:Uncharacterized protein n=1 Tax=Vanilla planifolia TaxID=51239 RepID=A0A835RQZ1_VANPL|nr:hypothetical protein HPP92_007486 [Vanilla planifolia]